MRSNQVTLASQEAEQRSLLESRLHELASLCNRVSKGLITTLAKSITPASAHGWLDEATLTDLQSEAYRSHLFRIRGFPLYRAESRLPKGLISDWIKLLSTNYLIQDDLATYFQSGGGYVRHGVAIHPDRFFSLPDGDSRSLFKLQSELASVAMRLIHLRELAQLMLATHKLFCYSVDNHRHELPKAVQAAVDSTLRVMQLLYIQTDSRLHKVQTLITRLIEDPKVMLPVTDADYLHQAHDRVESVRRTISNFHNQLDRLSPFHRVDLRDVDTADRDSIINSLEIEMQEIGRKLASIYHVDNTQPEPESTLSDVIKSTKSGNSITASTPLPSPKNLFSNSLFARRFAENQLIEDRNKSAELREAFDRRFGLVVHQP